MKIMLFPGYETHLLGYLREDSEELQKRGDGQDRNIRVYTPAGLPENAPIVMEVHGGAAPVYRPVARRDRHGVPA